MGLPEDLAGEVSQSLNMSQGPTSRLCTQIPGRTLCFPLSFASCGSPLSALPEGCRADVCLTSHPSVWAGKLPGAARRRGHYEGLVE